MADITTWQRWLSPLLWPLGAAYGQIMRARRRAYERGLLHSLRPSAPCVSIGNIAWGGTGKTPLTDLLLAWAEGRGLKPCVLTRGYGAAPPEPHYLVKPGADPAACGDEPLMLAERHQDSYVVVDPKRARAAEWAARELAPDLYLMDDGFQHLAVRRDLDIILLRPLDLMREWNRIIPAGVWRESTSALKRAGVFLVKSPPVQFPRLKPLAEERLEVFGRPVFAFHLAVKGLRDPATDSIISKPPAGPYVLISSTANPETVYRTAADFFRHAPAAHIVRPDHHKFIESDWLDAREAMKITGASLAVCTAKDAVKLKRLVSDGFLSLEVEAEFGDTLFTDLSFMDWWEQAWQELSAKSSRP